MKLAKKDRKKPNRFTSWQIPLTIALLIASFLLAVQFRTQQQLDVALSTQTNSDLIAMVRSLSEKRLGLEKELDDLNSQLASFGIAGSVEKQVAQLQLFTGAVSVSGAGVSIIITGDAPLVYLDLVDIINELKVSGAEAICVNDQRVSNRTKFAQGVSTGKEFVITMDGQKLETPVVISAIGNPATLETGLTFPGGIVDNLKHNGITPLVVQMENIVIPAEQIQEPEYMQKTTVETAAKT